MTVRKLDIELVTVGLSDAERLRSIWLEMLAGSPGVFYERLDEAMALGADEWCERAAGLNTHTSTAIAASRHGSFIGMIGGYIDQSGVDLEGHITFFHVVSGQGATLPTRGRVASILLETLAEWMVVRGVDQVFIGVREDQFGVIDRLLGLGFVPTGARRESELDTDYAEVELVCMLSGLAYDNVLHPAGGRRRASSPGEYRYRVV